MRWVLLRTVPAAILIVVHAASGYGQPCNPVVDGTYCAEQMPQGGSRGAPSSSKDRIQPIYGLGSEMNSPGYGPPATLGAITFGGKGANCIGLMRRSSCQ